MKRIKLPSIDYKALVEDRDAAKLERKGVATGRFTPSLYKAPPSPKRPGRPDSRPV
jgi:hypothetical protein